ncbi:uncharacterized protein [Palaemon carinicauda]|uniref:uncharacterized protein n=1 Tax=Palaemon carinicauda TaxID=392227 RepID=UPI0035B67DB2
MASTHNAKSVVGLRPGIPGYTLGQSDPLRRLHLSAKVACQVGGIVCFGILSVVSVILVVSGIAALGISNREDDGLPRFFEDPLKAAGTSMVLVGLVMMAILSGLWYTAEKRHEATKRKTRRLINATPSGQFLFPSSLTETSTVGVQTTSYFQDNTGNQLDPQLHHHESQERIPFSGGVPGGQMYYPAPTRARQLSYSDQSTGSELSYTSTSTDQMPYPTAPSSDQILCGLPSARQLFYHGESVSFSQQYRPSDQAYQSQALVRGGYTDDVNIDFLNEPPPPYSP